MKKTNTQSILFRFTIFLLFFTTTFSIFHYTLATDEIEKISSLPINPTSTREKNYIEGEVLIKYKDKATAEKTLYSQNTLQINDISVTDYISEQNITKIKSQTKSTEELLQEFSNDENVEIAEPNYLRTLTFTPNDPYFLPYQWAHYNTGQDIFGTIGTIDADIDSAEMWDITDSNSADTIVAVIDSGVDYNHVELSPNMWNGINCVDENNATISGGCPNHGWDYADSDNDPSDIDGHGTLVSSIIASTTNNSEGGTGTNRYGHTKIMAIRFSLDLFSELDAINFAKNNGAKVINASYGGSGYSQLEKDAIDAFPGVFVAASGNGGTDGIGDDNDSFPLYPCNHTSSNLICVAATDQNDNLASFSNYGTTSVDIAAPGVNIFGIHTGSYVLGDGTSFATPFVSGVAAQLYSHDNSLPSSQIRDIIIANDDDKSSLSNSVLSGGRLNAYKSLNYFFTPPIR
ncbi:MAG: S8 family peptidase, partial [Patescibacteria group bacterium]